MGSLAQFLSQLGIPENAVIHEDGAASPSNSFTEATRRRRRTQAECQRYTPRRRKSPRSKLDVSQPQDNLYDALLFNRVDSRWDVMKTINDASPTKPIRRAKVTIQQISSSLNELDLTSIPETTEDPLHQPLTATVA